MIEWDDRTELESCNIVSDEKADSESTMQLFTIRWSQNGLQLSHLIFTISCEWNKEQSVYIHFVNPDSWMGDWWIDRNYILNNIETNSLELQWPGKYSTELPVKVSIGDCRCPFLHCSVSGMNVWVCTHRSPEKTSMWKLIHCGRCLHEGSHIGTKQPLKRKKNTGIVSPPNSRILKFQ